MAHPSAHVARLKETFRSVYVEIIQGVQALPPAVRQQPDAKTMVAAVSHLIKSLVKRPDDQSSSRQLANCLSLGTRAANYGFPSVNPDAVSEDLTRIDLDAVPEEGLAILNYWYRKGPAGARIKHSKKKNPNQAVGRADGVDEEAESVSSEEDNDWNDEDEEWVRRFVNHRFPLYLWTIFPGRRSQVSHSLLEQPFANKMWSQIAQPGIQKQPLVRGVNAFASKVQEFFPKSWVTTRKHPIWQAYQTGILNLLRERAKARAQGNINYYNSKMHEVITQELMHWHFLPCAQTKLIWSYDGSGKNRTYRVVANPSVVSEENL